MKGKSVTYKSVLKDLEKKWPGIRKDVEAGLTKLRIAEHIADLRRRAHLSQKELARRIGTTQSNVARMESPDYRDYKVSTLLRIAEATGGSFVIEALG